MHTSHRKQKFHVNETQFLEGSWQLAASRASGAAPWSCPFPQTHLKQPFANHICTFPERNSCKCSFLHLVEFQGWFWHFSDIFLSFVAWGICLAGQNLHPGSVLVNDENRQRKRAQPQEVQAGLAIFWRKKTSLMGSVKGSSWVWWGTWPPCPLWATERDSKSDRELCKPHRSSGIKHLCVNQPWARKGPLLILFF